MKSESETRTYLSKIETINTNLHEKIKGLEPSNVATIMLSDRMPRNYAKIRALQCVLNG